MDKRSAGAFLSLRCRLGVFIGLLLLVLSFPPDAGPIFSRTGPRRSKSLL